MTVFLLYAKTRNNKKILTARSIKEDGVFHLSTSLAKWQSGFFFDILKNFHYHSQDPEQFYVYSTVYNTAPLNDRKLNVSNERRRNFQFGRELSLYQTFYNRDSFSGRILLL